ncbi:MAG: hypothetical protein U0935_16320 [Pirellulales bacterium]
MPAALLLSVVLLSVPPAESPTVPLTERDRQPTSVSRPPLVIVQVLSGTANRSTAAVPMPVEPWIREAITKAGGPSVTALTGWRALTMDDQRIYTSPFGGFFIDALVVERNGKYEVVVDGTTGVTREESILVTSGDKRVVPFTSAQAPTHVYLAFQVDPTIDDTIAADVVGTLRTGMVAIGGETTGVTITTLGRTWELDFRQHPEWRAAAEKLDGRPVRVRGKLVRCPGIEVKERWILTVREWQPAEDVERR